MVPYVYIALTAEGFILGAFRNRDDADAACALHEKDFPLSAKTRVSQEPLL